MEQTPLTYDNWETETRALRERLVEARDVTTEAIEKRTAELADLVSRIEKLDVALGDVTPAKVAPVSAPKRRDRGILVVVRGSVLPHLAGWTLETVVDAVRKIKPEVKVTSVRSALARLEKDGLVTVAGSRGSRLYYRKESDRPALLQEEPESDTDPIPSNEEPKGLGGIVSMAKSTLLVDPEKAEKTSLQATSVKGKMLFGGAEKPEHM